MKISTGCRRKFVFCTLVSTVGTRYLSPDTRFDYIKLGIYTNFVPIGYNAFTVLNVLGYSIRPDIEFNLVSGIVTSRGKQFFSLCWIVVISFRVLWSNSYGSSLGNVPVALGKATEDRFHQEFTVYSEGHGLTNFHLSQLWMVDRVDSINIDFVVGSRLPLRNPFFVVQ